MVRLFSSPTRIASAFPSAPSRPRVGVLFTAFLLLLLLGAVRGAPLPELPGEDVSTFEKRPPLRPPPVDTGSPAALPGGAGGRSGPGGPSVGAPLPIPENASRSWFAPPVSEQLGRDRTLITLGRGALFLPAFTEPRREPEITVYDTAGREVQSGEPGRRLLLPEGRYTLRFGSGHSSLRLRQEARVEEGHTTVVEPDWGGLLVETLNPDGDYVNATYELIRMDGWRNYGRGYGFREERLQDIRIWILPPGLYRLSKVGEDFGSYRNYITVQVNPGELKQVEAIFTADGDLVAGGVKSFSTRRLAGKHWSYGFRVGGNVNLTRDYTETNLRRELWQVAGDLRLRIKFDNTRYFGTNEAYLQNSFSKEDNEPFTSVSDIVQLRSTWVRRLNSWVGPYVRGQATSHLFPRKALLDTLYRMETGDDGVARPVLFDTSGDFTYQPSLSPLRLVEAVGVNLELFSAHSLELSTQLGLSAQQILVRDTWVLNEGVVSAAESEYRFGFENIVNARMQFSSFFGVDFRSEIFAPYDDPGDITLTDLTADFRFFLTQNLELAYIFRMYEPQAGSENRFPGTHNVSLRLSVNF